MERCRCNPEEIIAGHRPDCPLNEELAQVNKPLPPPRKPFEEMTRDEMILAHTALRHSIAEFVAGHHATQKELQTAYGWIRRLTPRLRESGIWDGDHACAQCRPHSDMIVKDFVCVVHRALAPIA